MSVGKGAQDLEVIDCTRDRFAAQALADGLDEVRREVGDVAQSLVFDLAVFAIATTQEVGLVDRAFISASSGGYMNCS
jgi:cobalamin-dependent methionine synthase I